MKREMFRAELLNAELGQLEEQLEQLERQRQEILQLHDALNRFQDVREDEELLVPLSAGVFAEARATGKRELLVNVGNGVVVRKQPDEIQDDLQEHMRQLDDEQRKLQEDFERKLEELRKLEETFKG